MTREMVFVGCNLNYITYILIFVLAKLT